MQDYSNKFQIRHLLSIFEDSLETTYKSNEKYCKLLIDPEETDNAMNVFKNQEFRVIEITKTDENFLEECKKFETLYELNFEKPFDRDILSKLIVKTSAVPNQRIVTQNHPRPQVSKI